VIHFNVLFLFFCLFLNVLSPFSLFSGIPEDKLELVVKDTIGRQVSRVPLKKNSDGSISLTFAPKQAGHYQAQLLSDGKPIFTDPYEIDVTAPVIIQQPSQLPKVVSDGSLQPFALVFVDNVPSDELAVQIRDKPSGRVVDSVRVHKRPDGTVTLAYAPKTPGHYTAVLVNGAVPIDETVKFDFEVLPRDTPMEKRVPIKPIIPISQHPVQFGLIQARCVTFLFMFAFSYLRSRLFS
jgi:hypothetical protein